MAKKLNLGFRKGTGIKFKDYPEKTKEPRLDSPRTMKLAFESIRWAFKKNEGK